MARNQFAKKSAEGTSVTFTFTDGHVLTVNVAELAPEIQSHLALHGAAQKIGDSYAGVENVAEAIEAAEETLEVLKSGKWSDRKVGTGASSESLLAMALLAIGQRKNPSLTMADIRAKLADKPKEWKAGARKLPEVVTEITRIQLERANAAAAKSEPEVTLEDFS